MRLVFHSLATFGKQRRYRTAPIIICDFVNLSDKLCYATVLSEEGIIGPLHAYWGTEETKIAFFLR